MATSRTSSARVQCDAGQDEVLEQIPSAQHDGAPGHPDGPQSHASDTAMQGTQPSAFVFAQPAPPPAPPSFKTALSSSLLSRPGAASVLAKPKHADKGSRKTADEGKKGLNGLDHPGGARNSPPASTSPAPSSAIDPLSQAILMRTSTDHSIQHRIRNSIRPGSPGHMADVLPRSSSDVPKAIKTAALTPDLGKEKKKGVSFLSRLSMTRTKRKSGFVDLDNDSELGSDYLTDGTNARVFSQAIAAPGAGGGFIPRRKEPPRYIRTKSHNKKTRDFGRMFLAQELVGTRPPRVDRVAQSPGHARTPTATVSVAGAGGLRSIKTGGAIWTTEFSKDGKFLAAAGRDHVVRVWAVITTLEERRACENEEPASGPTGERLSAPVFRDQPIREFEGHAGEVLDLSWSKNSFLLSSSMDKTVRLWHLSRMECLCTFRHKDFVPKLAFHPLDDRFFLAGSLDTMLRLWSIPDKTVAYSVQLPDLVTAVAFSPDGKTAIAGLLNGLCLFYETEGLKYTSQLHVRSSRGKNAKGSKITGIQTMAVLAEGSDAPLGSAPHTPTTTAPAPPAIPPRPSSTAGPAGEIKVLITSNDSRIRVYNLRDKSLDMKLKGHENACSQISANFSDDGKYIICGSECRKAFIWDMDKAGVVSGDKDKYPCEFFEAHHDMVTTAIFAPIKTRMLLGYSGDPIYELCNPPPVTLRSRAETTSAAASQTALSDAEASMQPSQMAEVLSLGNKKVERSPAYVTRSTHYDGHIIVTTDDVGVIKVFRQDCAFSKRKLDLWETGSTFSRKMGTSFIGNGFGRSSSIRTRNSTSSATQSRRGSVSHVGGSPQVGASDRILSWRQGIENGADKRGSFINSAKRSSLRADRSVSPCKPNQPSSSILAVEAQREYLLAQGSEAWPSADSGTGPTSTTADQPSGKPAHPQSSEKSATPKDASAKPSKEVERKDQIGSKMAWEAEDETTVPPTPSFSFRAAEEDGDIARIDAAGGGSSFWNFSRWRNIPGFRNIPNSRDADDNAGDDEVKSRRKSVGTNKAADKAANATAVGGRCESLLPLSQDIDGLRE